ncbi:hypothetical protein [Rheinheimera pacifica]|uniref:hypothetical protein n=1 Tax=Rheinheimera pacifica TaxID=173990 RepID=UPI002ED7ACBC
MSYPPLNARALRYLQQLQQRLIASGSERVKTSIKAVHVDAKDVSIALNEGYCAMLLPDLSTLQQHASPAMLPDKQLKFVPALATKAVEPVFQPYHKLLCQQLKGLRQQNMQGVVLKPISIR